MIQPRSYNTTYFRPKQQCNAILVEVICLSTIGDKKKKMLLDHLGAYFLSIGKGGASIFLIKFLMPLKI